MTTETAGWRSSAAAALPLWLGTRVAAVLLTLGAGWLLPAGDRGPRPRFLDQWHHWDTDLFRKVAEFGYFSPAYGDRTEAFFPGQPLAMRVVHLVVRDWIASGMVVAAIAGAVACVALHRLAAEESGAEAGRRAVLYLVLFPYAVFLFAGYSEALFLAFATTAWLAARREQWWLAGLLGAGASLTRVTGVALGVGLGVQFLVQRWPRDRWRTPLSLDAPALLLPAVPVVGYVAYLHAKTGHWDAYQRALSEGWGRHQGSPLVGWRATWHLATGTGQSRAFLWSWRVELLAMAIGVVVTVALLVSRRWGEAAFVGTNALMLSTSSYFQSTVRGLLVWFPAFLLLSRLSLRVRWLHEAVLIVFAPLCALVVLAFTEGTWLG
ncbi:MAG TPA: mannosyltransferase family protein [Mycobacteriales bacterium]|nr:mannosyltransferase family protein [Mycobacteriales bacterium]